MRSKSSVREASASGSSLTRCTTPKAVRPSARRRIPSSCFCSDSVSYTHLHQIKGDLRTIKAGDKIQLCDFKIETIRTTHSVADAICLAITTPAGVIFHTGDFKIDYTPVDGEPIDFARLAEIGKKGVTLLRCDLSLIHI